MEEKKQNAGAGFKPVSPKVNFPKLEEGILKYWKENKIFQKSLKKDAPYGNWTFLDGPPFVTGVPHYGSLLSSIPKDLFGRYYTMKGYHVRRVWGWDGHGLPIENKVETEQNIRSKKEIEEKVGVKKFIAECKKYVNKVSQEWEWYVDRIGRWVDFKNAYKTWDKDYMETVMWVFKQMYEKGYIYKGLRVTLYCPHCATPISNFEIALDNSYKEVLDAATIYKYELKLNPSADGQNSRLRQGYGGQAKLKTYILAWSTTPWNKIVTPALAVNPHLSYVKVEQGGEYYVLAKSTFKMLRKEPKYKIIEEFKGSALVGKKFVPHYDYYKIEKGKKAFEIIAGDFVTAEEGTGVVTIASYGEEDLKAMKANNIHMEMHLDEEGVIKPNVPLYGGMYYLKANKAVNANLAKRGLIYKDENLPHNVPICWRCATRLYYAPLDAWFVDVQKLKPLLKKTNEDVNWFPKHFKHGRFLKSLESAPDWNISRNRYWGSPVPVWECECKERFVPGSIEELEKEAHRKIEDLHKPLIDEIKVKCKKCGKLAKRTPEVLDSWIESGSASFAERHFPFSKTERLEDFFPPDFIAEYTGQIRAWFYVLHVIAGALYSSRAFRNVLVEGVILGTDGRKMSKNYGNYPDPKELLQKYGGDALRLYLLGSRVMDGEDILISEEQYRNQVKGLLLILWNVYNFFVTYANVDGWQSGSGRHSGKPRSRLNRGASRIAYDVGDSGVSASWRIPRMTTNNILDWWIISHLNVLVKEITQDLEKFDTISAIAGLQKFINDLSTWYIRRSRDRVGSSVEDSEDKNAFYETCYYVLTTICKLIAPITPFIAEEIYRNLTNDESVHLQNYPKGDRKLLDEKLIEEMNSIRKIVEMGHAKRKELGIKVRQPLAEFSIFNFKFSIDDGLIDLIREELNVKKISLVRGKGKLSVEFDTNITKELKDEGEARNIIRQIQEERKKLGTRLDEKVNVTLESWPKEFEEEIKRKAQVDKIEKGDKFWVMPL